MKHLLTLLIVFGFAAIAGAETKLKVKSGESVEIKGRYFIQPEEGVAVECWNAKRIRLTNFGISQGCILLSHGADSIELTNVYSTGVPNGNNREPGCYACLVWDTPAKSFKWDNSKLVAYLKEAGKDDDYAEIKEGKAEAAFRIKVERAEITGVHFVGRGKDSKPPVQVRHVEKSCTFTGCTFENGWIEIGKQKVQMGPIAIWDPGQHVKLVRFESCKFTLWTPAHRVYDRKPGVDRLEFVNCIDPDGKRFSGTY